MESQLQRYARRLVEEQLGHSRLQLAQIADDISTVKTEQDTKFTGDKDHGANIIDFARTVLSDQMLDDWANMGNPHG